MYCSLGGERDEAEGASELPVTCSFGSEQLLKLLLDDRTSQLERLLQEKQAGTSLGHEMDADLASLQGKWTALVLEAETR